MNSRTKREVNQPDGTLGIFYIETPLAAGCPFSDKMRSETFKQLKKDEVNLVLAKQHPHTPSITAESKVSHGPVGDKVAEQSLVAKTDDDGALSFPPEEEEFAKRCFVFLHNRYGGNEVRLHPKSLPWTVPPDGLLDVVVEQEQRKRDQLAESAARANHR